MNLTWTFNIIEKRQDRQESVTYQCNINLVLHVSPTTFLGCGLSGPLSRCPEVKYNHPSQNPACVVFARYGIFPMTDHVCTNCKKERKKTISEVKNVKKEISCAVTQTEGNQTE